LDHISIIKGPRQQWKIEHKLTDIIFLSIGGAVGWEEIQDFGEDHLIGSSNMAISKVAFLSMTQ
jgi:hypothetical protein